VSVLWFSACLGPMHARAQESGRPNGDPQEEQQGETLRDLLGRVDLYGEFLAQLAVFEGQAEIQDNDSRIGANFSIGEGIRFYAGVELGLSLIKATQFNPGAATGGQDALSVMQEPTPVFGSRLAFVGVDFGAPGRLALGKQESVHYDIAGFTTDRPNAFGGQGSHAYTAGTDGGSFGTGRVDQAVIHRLQVGGIFDFGAQVQFRSTSNTNFVDGYGFSARAALVPGFTVGAAYTRALIDESQIADVQGLEGDAEFAIFGARFDSDLVEVGVVYSTQKNGDAARLPDDDDDPDTFTPVFFGAEGFETYARVTPGSFGILGGFILNNPENPLDISLSPSLAARYVFLGGEYWFRSNTYVYAEWRIDDSVNFDDTQGFNVFTLGMRYGFSTKGTTESY